MMEEVRCAVQSTDPSDKGKRSFSVICDSRTYNLTADSPGTVKAWVIAFNAIGKHAHNRSANAERRPTGTAAPLGFAK